LNQNTETCHYQNNRIVLLQKYGTLSIFFVARLVPNHEPECSTARESTTSKVRQDPQLTYERILIVYIGSSAVKALLTPAYAKLKNVPKVTNEADATALLTQIIRHAFYLRVDKGETMILTSGQTKTKAKSLNINQMQMFEPQMYFAWFYEGSQWTTYLGGAVMVFVLLAGVMFPLWPPMFRQGVSYLSMAVLGLIGLFFLIAILRLIFWIITIMVAPPGIWIFPQLFADVGFVSTSFPSQRT